MADRKLLLALVVFGLVVAGSLGAVAGVALDYSGIYRSWLAAYRSSSDRAAAALHDLQEVGAKRLAFDVWLKLWDPFGLFNPKTQTFDASPESSSGGSSSPELAPQNYAPPVGRTAGQNAYRVLKRMGGF